MTGATDPVWTATVDKGTYRCRVERVTAYEGILLVERDDQQVLRRAVHLAYQALFGPDADDLAQWQVWCVEAIDADYKTRGEEAPQGGE